MRVACKIWTGQISNTGYGVRKARRLGFSTTLVHRQAYIAEHGSIPDNLPLDHLCRNRLCYEVTHLEPVTLAENVKRGNAPSTIVKRTGICMRGHVLSDVGDYDGECRKCRRDNHRVYMREYNRRQKCVS